MVSIKFTLILVLSTLGSISTDKAKDYEDHPYEFGFTIDGQQHRKESKDVNGIVRGEFGFITADGVYHVTVYATDEHGLFHIISMKNIRLGDVSPQGKSLNLPAQPSTTTLPPPPPPRRQIYTTLPPQTNPPTIPPPIVPVAYHRSCGSCKVPIIPNTQPPQIQQPALEQQPPVITTQQRQYQTPQSPSKISLFSNGQNDDQNDQSLNSLSDKSSEEHNSDYHKNKNKNHSNVKNVLPLDKQRPPFQIGSVDTVQPSQDDNGLRSAKQIDVDHQQGLITVKGNQKINIEDKYPGMQNGLPDGISQQDISNLLYKFNYTVGFHGHYEKGYKDGSKIGGYFINGRDGLSQIVTYVADANGYHPKVRFVRLGLDSPDTPKADTEKSFGLKNFEFVWYPIK